MSALVPNLNELRGHVPADSPGEQAVLCFDSDNIADVRTSLRKLVDGWADLPVDEKDGGITS